MVQTSITHWSQSLRARVRMEGSAEEVRARAAEARMLVLSARASSQPGLSSHLRERSGLEVFELPFDATVVAALRHHPRIRRDGDALPLVTRLPAWPE